MKEKKKLEIEITLTENTKIYNDFNNNQLSDELSNYIYSQCKGSPANTNMVLNINHNIEINDKQKEKLIDCIRENYGLDIRENLLRLKHEHQKEIFLIILGSLLLLISYFFNHVHTPLIGEIVSIFGCVVIWEIAYSLIFMETQIRLQNKRLKKLTDAKINFNKIT